MNRGMSAEQVRGKAGMDAGGSECRRGGGNRQEVCDHSHSIPVGDVNETLAITAKVFLFFQSTISTMMLIRTLRLRSGTLGESFAL